MNARRPDPSDAVEHRHFVIAQSGGALSAGSDYDIGRVVSYTDAPTFVLERPDGTRFSWRADLCRLAEAEDLEFLLHRQLDARGVQGSTDVDKEKP